MEHCPPASSRRGSPPRGPFDPLVHGPPPLIFSSFNQPPHHRPDKSDLVVTQRQRNEGFFTTVRSHAPSFGRSTRFSPASLTAERERATTPGPGRYRLKVSSIDLSKGVSFPHAARQVVPTGSRSAAGSRSVTPATSRAATPRPGYHHHGPPGPSVVVDTAPDPAFFGYAHVYDLPGPGRYNVVKSDKLLQNHKYAATFGTSTRFPYQRQASSEGGGLHSPKRGGGVAALFYGDRVAATVGGPSSASYQRVKHFASNTGRSCSFGKASTPRAVYGECVRVDTGAPGPGRYSPQWGLVK